MTDHSSAATLPETDRVIPPRAGCRASIAVVPTVPGGVTMDFASNVALCAFTLPKPYVSLLFCTVKSPILSVESVNIDANLSTVTGPICDRTKPAIAATIGAEKEVPSAELT